MKLKSIERATESSCGLFVSGSGQDHRYEQLRNESRSKPAQIDGFVYRGMSNEEWAEAVERGYILSDCRFAPYEGQENISCFGDYDTAKYYATELPIEKPEHINWEWRSETSRTTPYTGIIVEVPRHLTDGHEDDKQVHNDEFWAKGPIPLDEITRVWEFTPQIDGDSINFSKKQIK